MCNACNKKQQWGGAETSLNGAVSKTSIQPEQKWDMLKMFSEEERNIKSNIEDVTLRKGIKWYLAIKMKYVKTNQAGEEVASEPVFRSTNLTTSNKSQINEQLAKAFQQLFTTQQEFQREGSGWNLEEIIEVQINTAEYQPLLGSSYIALPKLISDKKAVINVQNNDQKCFMWSFLSALHPCHNSNRVTSYKEFEEDLNLEGIDFPTPLTQISRFERKNKISVNVFTYEEEVYPLYITKEKHDRHINLLLLTNGTQQHYCWIKDFSRLMGDRTNYK